MKINLFELAGRQAQWLSVRQAAIAGNIANVNTPGYRALTVEPFENLLGANRVALQATNVAHLTSGAGVADVSVRQRDDEVAVMPSGNSVVLEDELVDAGDVRRAFELNTAIVKAFHRMTMLVSKG